MSSIPPTIRVENLRFSYDDKTTTEGPWLLDNLTFNIRQGETLGIMGPNGCGKSTLINLLSKVYPPHDGQIFIGKQPLKHMKQIDVARMIAVLPQDIIMGFHYSVKEMVLMGRAPHQKDWAWETYEDYEIMEEALELTCTSQYANRWFLELSGGEKCRVLLARALAQRPKVFLLDEPTANLDLEHQTRMLDMLINFSHRHGSTVCIITHDLNLVGEYCDRGIILKNGKVYREGSPKEIIEEHTISDVYRATVHIGENPSSGAPHIFLKPQHALPHTSNDNTSDRGTSNA